MPPTHLKLDILERFAASNLDQEGMIAAGRHLSSCAPCRSRLRSEVTGGIAVLERLARKGWPEEEPTDFEGVFERLQARTLERIQKVEEERELAPRLAEELAGRTAVEQGRMIQKDARFQSAALVDLLLERCAVLNREDLAHAEKTARLALSITDLMRPGACGKALANDLRARAWAYICNTLRILSDFRMAESAMAKAESFLEEGSGDPLERARVLDLKASLLRSQRRFDFALATIDQVISIYRRIHERHRQGRALVSKAMILGHAGEQEKGISLFFQALDLIDTQKEPRIALAALNNLLVDLTELGRFDEAKALLPDIHKLLAQGTRADGLNVRWAEAQLESGLGEMASAEAKLHEVREEFIAEGIGYDAALASLDLAKIYLRQGRTAETRQLASEMHTIFISREIHREALVALVFFQRAAEQDRATVRLVEEITSYLRRAQDSPDLRFEKPAA